MRANRIAVCIFFFVNGLLYGNWTARLPAIQRFYDISNSMLGGLLFTMAVGAVLAMPFAGWLSTRFGSKTITQVGGILSCIIIPYLVFTPNLMVVGVAFFSLGLCVGATDVAMNGQAVFVERAYGKAIMSSFHAVFSIGMALGAGCGALFAKFEVALLDHLTLVAILGGIACLAAAFYLIDDTPEEDGKKKKGGGFVLPTKAILPLGIVAFCCMSGEGAMADWSAIYLNKVVGQSEYFSAIGYGVFATAMTIGRVFGDYFTERMGKYKLLIYNSIFSVSGLAIVLMFATTGATLIGLFLVGIGLATIVPIVYSSAGNMKGIDPSVGIAMATTIGYTGFFVGPPMIGFLSDAYGLRIGLGFVLVLFVAMLFLVLKINSERHKVSV
jgi:predicted MFS family arabinose efflux permease